MNQTSIRTLYRAPDNYLLVQLDLAQAESWVVAYLADERNMKQSLHYGDIHRDTAGNALFFSDVGCQHEWVKDPEVKKQFSCTKCKNTITEVMRYLGKRFNHASGYRMGPFRATEVINKDSDKPPYVTVTQDEARKFSEQWNAYYYLTPWWTDLVERLSVNGSLTTTYEFTRTFFGHWGDELFKRATAFEPQSTVAEHFNGKVHPQVNQRGGLIEIYRQLIKPYLQDGHKIVNQSHDSCILELPKTAALDIANHAAKLLLRPIIINGESFTIPVDCEYGERWGELEPFKLEV